MVDIPTKEPSFIQAGDTLQWTKALSDYLPSDGWTLKYRLINSAGKIDITAGTDDNDHYVNVSAATTDDYVAGTYSWVSFVEKGAGASLERYTIATGTIIVKRYLPGESAGYDTRSHARKMYDLLTTAIEGRASRTDLEYEISTGGTSRRLKSMSHEELFNARKPYARQMQIENARNRRKRGINDDFNVGIRFPG